MKVSIKYLLLLITLAGSLASWATSINTAVNRNSLALSETIQLTVTVDEQVAFSAPDFSDLEQQFDILDSRRSNQYKNINGRITSYTQWALTIAPKQEGKLLIPSFSYDGAFSDAIEVTVEAQPQHSNNQDVFIETHIDKSEVFVQEQVVFTQRLFSALNLRSIDPQPLKLDNARSEAISDNQFQTRIKGRLYHVVEIKYALFPQSSGELIVPALRWKLMMGNGRRNVFDPFGSDPARMRRLSTEAKTIRVKPIPKDSNSSWLPAAKVQLTQQWAKQASTIKVGEPMTRVITLTAEGLTAAQLPNIVSRSTDQDAIKVYPEQPQTSDSKTASGINGKRVFTEAIIANKVGNITLEPIKLRWWNTSKRQWQVTEIPAISFNAIANPDIPNEPAKPPVETQTAQANDSASNKQQIAALKPESLASTSLSSVFAVTSLLLLLAFGVLLWLYFRLRLKAKQLKTELENTQNQHLSNERAAIKPRLDLERSIQALDTAVNQSDLKAACVHSQTIQKQLQSSFADYHCQQQAATELNALLAALNKAVYGGGANVDITELSALFRALQHQLQQAKADATIEQPLDPLNPF